MNSKPFVFSGSFGHVPVIRFWDNTQNPPVILSVPTAELVDVSGEYPSDMSLDGGLHWVVTGIPDDGISKTLEVGDFYNHLGPQNATDLVWGAYLERFDFDYAAIAVLNTKISDLLALFATPSGTNPVTIHVTESGLPVTGVEISVWDETLAVPVVPRVLTTTGGIATCALPNGTYKVFCFKPYGSFIGLMPYTLVVSGASVLDITMSSARPALPTAPRLTLFGWVLRADLTPLVGAEVKLRILSTPQIVAGGAGLSKFDLIALTDAEGRFELYPIAGVDVMLTCDQVGYARKGRLPGSGSLNWRDFAVTTI